jgi:hypothetical protein
VPAVFLGGTNCGLLGTRSSNAARLTRDRKEKLRVHGPPRRRIGTCWLADPITLSSVEYRPLPPDSALGLSAFYIALLTLMCGFLAGTIINATVDAATGYATTEIGPRWRQRAPLPINRWQTLLTKW